MRFRIPGLLPDTVSAEEVRAVRETRGWTVEELADAVHASPLEVSAWEAGAVRVPPEQAERVRWLAEMDAWSAAVARVRGEPCEWVREHVPHLYEIMFIDVAGITWYSQSAEIREHFAGCATCQATWKQAERTGGRPRQLDDAPDTWRTRYRRWTRRFPGWIRAPLNLLGDVPQLVVIVLFISTVPDPHSGFAARVFGLSMGVLFGWAALALASGRAEGTRLSRVRAVLAGITAGAVGLVGWSLFDAAVDLRDLRLWAVGGVVGVALGLIRAARANADADPGQAVAPQVEPAALGGPQPHPDLGAHTQRAADAVEARR